jgi:putative ABC transport system permease protein
MYVNPRLFKISYRYFIKHPFQTAMMVLGIALGVALVVSIDIANASVEASFQKSTQSITGRATHQIIGTYQPLNQSIYTTLKTKLDFEKSAPVIIGHAIVKELNNKPMQILGIDPFSEFKFRSFDILKQQSTGRDTENFTDLILKPGAVMISSNLASKHQIKKNSQLTLVFGNKEMVITIIGFITITENSDEHDLADGLLYMDISSAQEILNLEKKISYIDLILDNESKNLPKIKSLLPNSVKVLPTARKSAAIREMSKSFEFNLSAFSLLALLVGLFLIYNTVVFSIISRRQMFGILRALGVTRQEIFYMVISESFFLGIVGTLIGLLLGAFLGIYTVRMVSQTVSGLYYFLPNTLFHISLFTLVKGVLLGIVVSVLSSLLPALEANQSQANDTLHRSDLELKTNRWLPYLSYFGLILNITGITILVYSSKNVPLGFLGTAFIVFGFAFFIPMLTRIMILVFLPVLTHILGITAKMALRSISRSLSRTGVSIAALMIAISVYIGVGIMINSFKGSLNQWVDHNLKGDVHIGSSDITQKFLPSHMIKTIKSLPIVDRINEYQFIQLQTGPYINATLFVTTNTQPNYQWVWKIANSEELGKKFLGDVVFISESFAWKHDITATKNNVLTLDTPKGIQNFRVGGVFSDFFLRGGRIVIHRNTYTKFWSEVRPTQIEVYLKNINQESNFIKTAEAIFDNQPLLYTTQVQIRKRVLKAFDNTFAITIALQILSALVAVIGILNTIMSLIYERFREIGVLRANGLSIGQLWKMLMIESGFIGLLSGLIALPLGTVLSWILIAVINKRSFGWTLNFSFDTNIYMHALMLSIGAALFAGIYPAWRASRTQIMNAIRTE